MSLVADVSTEKAAVDAVNLARHQFGKLDILVNNAGRMTLHDWNTIMDVSFLHSPEALKAMIAHKCGAIVNIGSYACYQTFPGISAS